MKVSSKVAQSGAIVSTTDLLKGVSHLAQARRVLRKTFGPNYTSILKLSHEEKIQLEREVLSLEDRISPSLLQFLSNRIQSIQILHAIGIEEGIVVKELSLHHGMLRGIFTGACTRKEKLRLQITALENDQYLSANPEFATYCDSQEAQVVKCFGGRPRFVIMYPLPQAQVWDVIPFQIPLGALPLDRGPNCLLKLSLIGADGESIYETHESILVDEMPEAVNLSFAPQAIGLWPIDPKTGSWITARLTSSLKAPSLLVKGLIRGEIGSQLIIRVSSFSINQGAEVFYEHPITFAETIQHFALQFCVPWEEEFEFLEIHLRASSGEILCGEIIRAPHFD